MKATDTFRHPAYGHNCAQAIAHKWSRLYSDRDIVARYAPYKGGRAPDGCCGALYAAMQACPEHAAEIKDEFVARCGAWQCRDLKGKGRIPCETCVDTADLLLEFFSDTNINH